MPLQSAKASTCVCCDFISNSIGLPQPGIYRARHRYCLVPKTRSHHFQDGIPRFGNAFQEPPPGIFRYPKGSSISDRRKCRAGAGTAQGRRDCYLRSHAVVVVVRMYLVVRCLTRPPDNLDTLPFTSCSGRSHSPPNFSCDNHYYRMNGFLNQCEIGRGCFREPGPGCVETEGLREGRRPNVIDAPYSEGSRRRLPGLNLR